jgi:hypothetical protein
MLSISLLGDRIKYHIVWQTLNLQHYILLAYPENRFSRYLCDCYEPTKYGTGRAYRMQATGARQVGTGRTEVLRSRAKY